MSPLTRIVLVEPQLGENIGATARAMANFELAAMRLVRPRDGWPNLRALRSATGGGRDVVENAETFNSLDDALNGCGYVAAASARRRDSVMTTLSASEAANEIARRERSGEPPSALILGREKWGLTNEEVSKADALVVIPTSTTSTSLNVAQAGLLIAWEIFRARKNTDQTTTPEKNLAPKEELLRLFEHAENALTRSGFLRPPEKAAAMARNLRGILHRAELTSQEIKTLRGAIRSLDEANRS